ncbi:TetR/AcrR family transcriptional regulator [Altererythrobacter aquiaggeris]|uniref:TetR/AcrR family transcriptional regulator n=1 Tax=Aestuarierythrobacter aquiaggeris TaxID=1898396 RepID=UPI003015CECD
MIDEESASKPVMAAPHVPRTARGRATRRKILDSAAIGFGEKGFHETSIVSITSRAGVALGSFYTYFASKDVLFRALVQDMSGSVRDAVAPAIAEQPPSLEREGKALAAFLSFAREHKELYRIIDEAEFVAPEAWQDHYATTATRIETRLAEMHEADQIRTVGEVEAWAIMGMNVFLGLRYGVQQDDADMETIAARMVMLLRQGLSR